MRNKEKKQKKGINSRKYEQDFDLLKIGEMLQELRKEKGLSQEQLAQKTGTTRTYISRVENNVTGIRLSTLIRILTEGLDASLKLNVKM